MHMAFHVLVVIFVYCLSSSRSVEIRAPTIFQSGEPDLHKYSAVLAATEPFRAQCEDQIRRSLNPVSYSFRRLLGKSSLEVGESERDKNIAVNVALTRFKERLQNALRSYGMEENDFNELSTIVSKEKVLKRKVLLQSYLYKLAADLEANLQDKKPPLPSNEQHGDKSISTSSIRSSSRPLFWLKLQKRIHIPPLQDAHNEIPILMRFVRTLHKIEAERIRVRDQIKRDLHVRELPPRMADPEYLPAMCPTIQKACNEFPNHANQIIRRNGLQVEEFNLLQKKLANNLWFRYRVQLELQKIKQAE